MSATTNHPTKLPAAYKLMLERVKAALGDIEFEAASRLHYAVELAQDKAAELGELTREEAEKVGDFLKRDVEDAAGFLAGEEGSEFAQWLRFDIERIEDDLLDSFMSVADQTRLDFVRLQHQALAPVTYHTGEIAGIGTLTCTQCGHTLQFASPGHIPPCAKCNGTLFAREDGNEP